MLVVGSEDQMESLVDQGALFGLLTPPPHFLGAPAYARSASLCCLGGAGAAPSVLPFVPSHAGALLGHVVRAPLSSPVDGCERKASALRLGVLPELPSGPPVCRPPGRGRGVTGALVDIRINVLLERGGGCVSVCHFRAPRVAQWD